MSRYPKSTHAYVGVAPCGCVLALAAYHYEQRESTARAVAQMIRDGLIVRCLTWSEYQAERPALADCPHGKILDGDSQQPPLALD